MTSLLLAGDVLTTNNIQSLDVIVNKRVGVVGFGKAAVVVVSSLVERDSKVEHIFRTPRWLVPFLIGGVLRYYLLDSRLS